MNIDFAGKENQRVRKAARAAGIPIWKIAVRIGVCEQTLIRWLRVPLTPDREKMVMEAIAELEKEGEA